MSDVNLDRLRELAGHLRNACRQLHEFGRHDFLLRQGIGDYGEDPY